MALRVRKKGKPALVFVPSKPWSAAERRNKISLKNGRITIPARFFEQVFDARRGKRVLASKAVLKELFSSKYIPPTVSSFVRTIMFGTKRTLKIKIVANGIDEIAKCLDRRKMSPELFTFLEDLRALLIERLWQRP